MNSQTQTVQRHLCLYGAMSQGELKNLLELRSIDSDERKLEIMDHWKEAAKHFQLLATAESGLTDSIGITEIESKWAELVRTFSQHPLFKATFSTVPTEFKIVEADKLVASQRTVNLDYVASILSGYQNSEENLLRFCLDPVREQPLPRIMRSQQNAFTFSSINPDFRFLGAYEKQVVSITPEAVNIGGQPVWSVVLLVGDGISTINAFRVNRRVILNNGFHRAYVLRKLGVERIPLAIQVVTSAELEFPPVVANLPKDYLSKTLRPALLKDFLDPELVCEISIPVAIRAIRTAWGADQSDVPV
jgi:hypothetical protein